MNDYFGVGIRRSDVRVFSFSFFQFSENKPWEKCQEERERPTSPSRIQRTKTETDEKMRTRTRGVAFAHTSNALYGLEFRTSGGAILACITVPVFRSRLSRTSRYLFYISISSICAIFLTLISNLHTNFLCLFLIPSSLLLILLASNEFHKTTLTTGTTKGSTNKKSETSNEIAGSASHSLFIQFGRSDTRPNMKSPVEVGNEKETLFQFVFLPFGLFDDDVFWGLIKLWLSFR